MKTIFATMFISFFDIIDLLVVYQGLFLVFLLIYKSEVQARSLFWLAGFVLTISLDYLNTFFFSTKLVLSHPWLAFMLNGMPLLSGPLLYLFVKVRTEKSFINQHKFIWLLHLLPFLAVVIWSWFRYYRFSVVDQQHILKTGEGIPTWEISFIIIAGFAQIFTYLIFSFIQVFRYERQLKEHFSNLEKVSLGWLKVLILGFSFIELLNAGKNVWSTSVIVESVYLLIGLLTLAYLNIIVFRVLNQQVFRLDDTKKNKKPLQLVPQLNYEFIINQLTKLLNQEQLYRDSTLTLTKLAAQTPFSCTTDFYCYQSKFRYQLL